MYIIIHSIIYISSIKTNEETRPKRKCRAPKGETQASSDSAKPTTTREYFTRSKKKLQQ